MRRRLTLAGLLAAPMLWLVVAYLGALAVIFAVIGLVGPLVLGRRRVASRRWLYRPGASSVRFLAPPASATAARRASEE